MESFLFNVGMDINCDLGEGIGNDEVIMEFIGSCNIACGGHAGDLETMRRTVMMAKDFHVKIGAHPSFMDRLHFGRQVIEVSKETLKTQLLDQIHSLLKVLDSFGLPLHHVKPHGALYNLIAKSEEMSALMLEVMQELDEKTLLYVPFDSEIESLARSKGVPIWIEAFADRNYNDDFSLMSRSMPEAVINDPEEVRVRVENIIQNKELTSINGITKKAHIDTICLHGDHENAVDIAKILYDFKDQIN